MVGSTQGAQVPIPPRRRRDRPVHRRRVARALAASIWLAAPPALAIHGTVEDAEGKAVGGARVCYVDGEGQIQRCTVTNRTGAFDMPSMQLDTLEVAAEGSLVATVSAGQLDRPIVLDPAPTLRVRLVDARTGEPIGSGRVFVTYPSGKEVGPFPVNRAGVRVRRVVEPGKIRLRVESPGYAAGRPREVELIGGEETEVELRLEPEPEPERERERERERESGEADP